MKILVVDDDPDVVDIVGVAARFQWPDVTTIPAYGGEQALDLFREHAPDLIVLDVAMPGTTGFDVLGRIRQSSDVPVVLLTGRTAEADHVRGLDLGADEYVVKPFSPLLLLARIRALVRRTRTAPPVRSSADFRAGTLSMDFNAQRVWLSGKPVELGPAEYRLLYHLVQSSGEFVDHGHLAQLVWGSDAQSPGNLKSLVSRLRVKLGTGAGAEHVIENRRGAGYRLVRHRDLASAVGDASHLASAGR
jgi:DNA-binding response OmpR family regulator